MLLKRRIGHVNQSDNMRYAEAFGELDFKATENLLDKCRHLAADHRGYVVQQTGSFLDADALLRAAVQAEPILIEGMRSALSAFDGCEFVVAPMKTKKRILEKVKKDYHGIQYHKVVDVVRASAIFSYPTDLAAFIRKLSQPPDKHGGGMVVLRVKDRFNSPLSGGYRDMLVNVRVSGSHFVGELQLHLKKIKAVQAKAPRIYEVMRSFGWEEAHMM